MRARFFAIGAISVIGLVIFLGNPVFALPAVESRTGDPVFRAPTHSEQKNARTYPMTAEDRAAQLTLTQLESLQNEVRELRGIIELQEHELKQLKKSQQDFYVDLDRRLNQLQSSQSRSTANERDTPSKSPKSTSPSTAKSSALTTSPSSAPTKSISPKSEISSKNSSDASRSVHAAQSATTSVERTPETMAISASKAKVNKGSELSGTSVHHTVKSTIPSSETASQSVSKEEQGAYQVAYGFVRTKRYPEAISSFQEYLSRFPRGEHAVHAHYWLGEVYMVQWQNDKTNDSFLEQAAAEFQSIISQFPTHPKAGDATLKLGLIEFERGNEAAAVQYLTDVKTRYPGTAAARIADTRLQRVE